MGITSEIVELLGKVYPLYIVIALGYIFGKRTQYGRKQLAFLIIYFIGPLVFFHGAATAPHGNNNVIAVPVLFFCFCVLLSYISMEIGKKLWRKGDKPSVLAFEGGTANMGSFGIPLVLAFFGEAGVSVAIYSAMANILFENTVGYYTLIHGKSVLASVKKVLALPAIYAFAFGVFLHSTNYQMPGLMSDVFSHMRLILIGAGMFLIGMSIADVKRSHLDPKFTSAIFGIKFLIFPTIMMIVMAADQHVTHVFDPQTRSILLLLSVMPSGSNIIAFVTRLHKHPELVGFTVLATTLFALIYIPIFAAIFL